MKCINTFILFFLISTEVCAERLIKGDNLFTNATNSYVQLSPDGALLSFIEAAEDGKYLMLFDTAVEKVRTSIRIGARSQLRNYYWLSNDLLLLDIRRDGINMLISGKVGEKNVQLKTHEFYGSVINLLPQQPDKLLFSLQKKGFHHNLLLISVEDFLKGEFDEAQNTEFGIKNIQTYRYDHVSDKLLLSTYNNAENTASFYWQELGKEHVYKFLELKDFEDFLQPVHFMDNNRLAVLTNKNTDKIVLQEFFIESQSLGDVIYSHDNYDLKEATFDYEGQLFSVSYYEHGIFQRSFFQESTSMFAKRLKKTFPDQSVYIIDASVQSRSLILRVASSDEPGTYYLYKEGSDTARVLMSRYPQLDPVSLARNERLQIKIDKNTQLEAYLTRPTHYDLSTLLVYPHGGPIGVRETDQYQADIQYLANRGFTVLRVNFRGSSGFGKAFQNKGVGQFGKLIEEDIMTTVRQVLLENSFDHMCAMGSSYGGYSAAMLAIKHPDMFECVVASFGIFDLPLLFNESNVKMHEDNLKSITNVVGDFSEDLRDVSPLYLAPQHKAPLLLIAGRTDEIASFEHSNRFKYVLNKLGHSVETMFYDNTGHGHSNWVYDHHEAATTFDFLVRTLDLDISGMISDTQSKTALAEDYLIIADKFEFDDNVPDNLDKAFEYLQKAAQLNAPRAVFNMGVNYHTGTKVDKNIELALAYYHKAGDLGYEEAYRRLGTLYMQGVEVAQNWELAHDFLTKAAIEEDKKSEGFETVNNILERLRLGRFYCIAPIPWQNVDKCIELFDIEAYKERSYDERKGILNELLTSLSWAIIDGVYDVEDKRKLQGFLTENFKFTHLATEIEELELGVFNFVVGEKFKERNEYELDDDADLTHIIPSESTRIGLRFDADVKGMDNSTDKTGVVIRWLEQTDKQTNR